MSHRLDEYRTTTNSPLWKKLHKRYLEHTGKIDCAYCRPNHIENWSNKDMDRMKRLRKRVPVPMGDTKTGSQADIWNHVYPEEPIPPS